MDKKLHENLLLQICTYQFSLINLMDMCDNFKFMGSIFYEVFFRFDLMRCNVMYMLTNPNHRVPSASTSVEIFAIDRVGLI